MELVWALKFFPTMGGDSLALIFFPADAQQMLNVKKWPCMFLLKRILRREDDESLNIECWLVEISVPVTSIVVVALPAKARHCPLYQIQSTFEFTVLCIYINTQAQICIISCRDTDPNFTLKLHCRTFESVTRTVHFGRTQYMFNGEEHQGNSSQQCEKVWQRVALDT